MRWVWVVACSLILSVSGCGSSGSATAPVEDVAQEVTPDTSDTSGDTGPDVASDVTLDLGPDIAPDVVPDIAPDVVPDIAPDVVPDTTPDVVPDIAPDVVPDTTPDVEPDIAPDVEPDTTQDVAPDAGEVVDPSLCLGVDCDDGVPCTIDSCLEETGGCEHFDVCAEAMTDGMMVYTTPADDGNTFSCNTCHALEEPSEDGIRRVGHLLGDATHRPSYKNGQLSSMREAANSCRTGWMNASAWDEDNPSWLALYSWLDEKAPDGDAPALSFTIVSPPADMEGGDAEAGNALFNMACVMCHGTDAVGTIRGPPLAGTQLPLSYIATRVRTSGMTDSPVYDGLTGGIMPFWAADRLSDDELRNVAAWVSTSEAAEPEDPEDPENPEDPEDPGPFCDATHPKVGWTTTLSTLFHGVEGVATLVDDCTIKVENFHFDGNGIDVQMYAAENGNYGAGFSVSDQLYNFPVGYEDVTLMLKVPEGKTLDDVGGISVWCVTVGVSFGHGLFAAP
jgi:cytochrome c